jgi:hypothetical protein
MKEEITTSSQALTKNHLPNFAVSGWAGFGEQV